MKVKLKLSYDGTAYCGWQIQPNGTTVQEVLETALEKVTGKNIKVTGSGRTDAGVHAKGQVAHFETPDDNIPAEKFFKALNVHLPPDVRVLLSERIDDGFDARKSAKSKTYSYFCYVSDVELPLKERYAVKLDRMPDIEKMKNAASILIGEHDFKCMCSSGSGAKTTVRTVYSIDFASDGENVIISVCGNGFLYNMVRIMVGTLLDVGFEKLTEKDLQEMLSSGKRNLGGKTLPAKGLCLMSVKYNEN